MLGPVLLVQLLIGMLVLVLPEIILRPVIASQPCLI